MFHLQSQACQGCARQCRAQPDADIAEHIQPGLEHLPTLEQIQRLVAEGAKCRQATQKTNAHNQLRIRTRHQSLSTKHHEYPHDKTSDNVDNQSSIWKPCANFRYRPDGYQITRQHADGATDHDAHYFRKGKHSSGRAGEMAYPMRSPPARVKTNRLPGASILTKLSP